MNIRRISLTSIAVTLLGIGLVWFCMREPLSRGNSAQELLQKASFEQRWFVSNLCKELVCESTMGYTLFGDKPISNTTIRGQILNRRFFFVPWRSLSFENMRVC
jgi:hypothetical protein